MSILLAHIAIALTSVAFTTILLFAPSKLKLHISYALMGLTLASGTLLLIENPAHMVQACTSGLLYTGLTTFGILTARNRLAAQKQ